MFEFRMPSFSGLRLGGSSARPSRDTNEDSRSKRSGSRSAPGSRERRRTNRNNSNTTVSVESLTAERVLNQGDNDDVRSPIPNNRYVSFTNNTNSSTTNNNRVIHRRHSGTGHVPPPPRQMNFPTFSESRSADDKGRRLRTLNDDYVDLRMDGFTRGDDASLAASLGIGENYNEAANRNLSRGIGGTTIDLFKNLRPGTGGSGRNNNNNNRTNGSGTNPNRNINAGPSTNRGTAITATLPDTDFRADPIYRILTGSNSRSYLNNNSAVSLRNNTDALATANLNSTNSNLNQSRNNASPIFDSVAIHDGIRSISNPTPGSINSLAIYNANNDIARAPNVATGMPVFPTASITNIAQRNINNSISRTVHNQRIGGLSDGEMNYGSRAAASTSASDYDNEGGQNLTAGETVVMRSRSTDSGRPGGPSGNHGHDDNSLSYFNNTRTVINSRLGPESQLVNADSSESDIESEPAFDVTFDNETRRSESADVPHSTINTNSLRNVNNNDNNNNRNSIRSGTEISLPNDQRPISAPEDIFCVGQPLLGNGQRMTHLRQWG